MAQIFHRSFNTLSRLSIFGAVFILSGLGVVWAMFIRSDYVTRVLVFRDQPVPFSHQHHVGGLGIDCRYCHTSVEKSSYAGIPATEICMNCHSQIWVKSPMLEPVRTSYRSGESIPWVRVHNLADFVYFNHSIHIDKGVGCATCHGQLDQMPLTTQIAPLLMEWCLECHRNPERYLRPREHVFSMDWRADDQLTLGKQLLTEYRIKGPLELTSCSTCHR
jgi:hypothetical protein